MPLKTICVDDEPMALEGFRIKCEADDRFTLSGCFTDPTEALAFAQRNRVDFAILDIDMPEIDGLELSKRLRDIYSDIIIMFVTAHSKYAVEAVKLRPDYYVLKPYNMSDIADVLERAKLLSVRQKKRVFIRTFGEFDVFCDGKAIRFSSQKAKELLALLVDKRGGDVTSAMIVATLWEDKPADESVMSQCRKVMQRLRDTLRANGIESIIIENRNSRRLNCDEVDCDLFDYMNNHSLDSFFGEYMSRYSWAETTLGTLERIAGQSNE